MNLEKINAAHEEIKGKGQNRIRSFSKIAMEMKNDKMLTGSPFGALPMSPFNYPLSSVSGSTPFNFDFELDASDEEQPESEQKVRKQSIESNLTENGQGLSFSISENTRNQPITNHQVVEEKTLSVNMFGEQQEHQHEPNNLLFTNSFLTSQFTPLIKVNEVGQKTKTSKTAPFNGSGVVESSQLYNLDLDSYYSTTSETQLKSQKVDSDASYHTFKRSKAKLREESISMTRSRTQERLNAGKQASMVASLDNAPMLKLRRRTIERRVEGYSSLRDQNGSERVLSHQIVANREIFRSPFHSLSKTDVIETRTYKKHCGSGAWVGSYSPQRRKLLIRRFLEKRKRRIWKKKIRYAVRKNFADSRLRVKGRFVGKDDERSLRDCLVLLS